MNEHKKFKITYNMFVDDISFVEIINFVYVVLATSVEAFFIILTYLVLVFPLKKIPIDC